MDDMRLFCHSLPKIELHAHLNGSLSSATMLQLMRLHVDSGRADKTNAFFDEFNIAEGDTRSLSECFQMFRIVHSLTTTPEALALATSLTLNEFQSDGCCYIELRSTPRDTPEMNKKLYIKTIVETLKKCSKHMTMLSKFIVSINRASSVEEANEISELAIEFYKQHPDVVVGIELSGNPTTGVFQDFVPAFTKARGAGLKVSLHCAEIINPAEVLQMLKFKPDRLGHGIHIHPKFGGTDETWQLLCENKIPVEICLTSNVKTKSVPDYESHHLMQLQDAGIPFIICTDDKGVFSTSLSQEYCICAQTFQFDRTQMRQLAVKAINYVFDSEAMTKLSDKFESCIKRL